MMETKRCLNTMANFYEEGAFALCPLHFEEWHLRVHFLWTFVFCKCCLAGKHDQLVRGPLL